jgi:hypothetical protein
MATEGYELCLSPLVNPVNSDERLSATVDAVVETIEEGIYTHGVLQCRVEDWRSFAVSVV